MPSKILSSGRIIFLDVEVTFTIRNAVLAWQRDPFSPGTNSEGAITDEPAARKLTQNEWLQFYATKEEQREAIFKVGRDFGDVQAEAKKLLEELKPKMPWGELEITSWEIDRIIYNVWGGNLSKNDALFQLKKIRSTLFAGQRESTGKVTDLIQGK